VAEELRSRLPRLAGVALEDIRKRTAVLCIGVILFCIVVYQVAVLCLAWRWGSAQEFSQQIRGADLAPGNAEAWDRLGEALTSNFDSADPARAISFFQRAVEVDPRSAHDWMDLAQAYEINGNAAGAATAYEQAQRDYPISAEVSWKYGNFLLRQGKTAEGLHEVHQALVTDPSLITLAISRIWDAEADVQVILRDVLPAGEGARFQALNFFAVRHNQAAALETWEDIASLAKTKPIAIQDAFPFLEDLIRTDQAAQAARIWREVLAAARLPDAKLTDDSLIWNGGFEKPIVNGGLGWRLEQVPGAYISVDSTIYHSGRKSLRVDFTGGVNLDFWNVHEYVPVEPRTHYVFECFMRTQSISTDSGMRFEIEDLNDNGVQLLTPDLTGTNSWTPVRTDVATGQYTRFLDVRLRRLPSRLFDNKLSGTVWVDDVSLLQEPSQPAETRP
jgi:tetratricopeptide (TPR) repeat protein